jgi:hypothetical protein
MTRRVVTTRVSTRSILTFFPLLLLTLLLSGLLGSVPAVSGAVIKAREGNPTAGNSFIDANGNPLRPEFNETRTFKILQPYETLAGVTKTPGNGVFFRGETPLGTARYTPICKRRELVCFVPVLCMKHTKYLGVLYAG